MQPVSDSLGFVEQMYQALNQEDLAPFLALCAHGVVIEYPAAGRLPYGGTWEGLEAVAGFLRAHDDAEEILTFETRQVLADGERVVVVGHFEGRAKPGTATWSTAFVHTLTVRDGRLHRWQAYFDTFAAVDAHDRSERSHHRG